MCITDTNGMPERGSNITLPRRTVLVAGGRSFTLEAGAAITIGVQIGHDQHTRYAVMFGGDGHRHIAVCTLHELKTMIAEEVSP